MTRAWAITLAGTLWACTGTIGEPGGGSVTGVLTASGANGRGSEPGGAGSCGQATLLPARIWRLTTSEYRNDVRDVLGLSEMPDVELEVEPIVDGFHNNADALSVTTRFADQVQKAASKLASSGVPLFASLAKCAPAAVENEVCAQEFIAAFGLRAFRRPLTSEEIAGYVDVYRAGKADEDGAGGVRLVIETMLQSPNLLYRTELGDPTQGAPSNFRLGNFEIASSLSFSLWGGPPDDALLAAADKGTLTSDAELEAQARRLLSDPRAREVIGQFATEWLAVREPSAIVRDAALFPGFDALKADMYQEVQLLMQNAFFGEHAALASVFESPESYVSKPLADYYGLSGSFTQGTVGRASLSGTGRTGLLTSGALLASWSGPTDTKPMTRGRLLMDRLLCQTMPPPPPTLKIPPVPDDKGATTRQRFEIHANNAGCSACHLKLDAVAFALENFDSVGRYRTEENGKPIDASGTISETTDANGPFRDAPDLAHRLSTSIDSRTCLATQYLRFTSGAGQKGDSDCLAQALVEAAAKNADSPTEMLVAMVKSEAFRTRRAPDP